MDVVAGVDPSPFVADELGLENSPLDEPGKLIGTHEPSTTTATKDERENKVYLLMVICVLLLLLMFLLVLFNGFMSSDEDRKNREATGTEPPLYVLPTPPSHPPASAEIARGETSSSTAMTTPMTTPPPSTTTSSTTTSTTRTPATGYGYMVCTIGRGLYNPATFPIKEELCDIIVYTHVSAFNDNLTSDTGFEPYDIFIEAATLYKNDRYTRFGLSHSPRRLGMLLQGTRDVQDVVSHFLTFARTVVADAGISALGVMGVEKGVAEFTHDAKLAIWFRMMSAFVKQLANGTLFLGLKLLNPSQDLASKPKLAADVFQTVIDMEVTLLVLITHNIEEEGPSTCVTTPISSWSPTVYKDPTKPALEHVFKFLQFALASDTRVEVTLSSALAFVTYHLKEAVQKPVKFGEPCVAAYPQHFEAYCMQNVPNLQEHDDSMTALGFNETMLSTFETPETVEKKMRRFLVPLKDLVSRRVGWAFFDLAFEVFNNNDCPLKNVITKNFSRIDAAKAILEESRNLRLR